MTNEQISQIFINPIWVDGETILSPIDARIAPGNFKGQSQIQVTFDIYNSIKEDFDGLEGYCLVKIGDLVKNE